MKTMPLLRGKSEPVSLESLKSTRFFKNESDAKAGCTCDRWAIRVRTVIERKPSVLIGAPENFVNQETR